MYVNAPAQNYTQTRSNDLLKSHHRMYAYYKTTNATFHNLRLLAVENQTDLVRDDETSNSGGSQRGSNAGDEGRHGEARNLAGARGSKLAENTDLDTERTNVAETADGVGGNELGARRQIGQCG